MTTAIYLDHYLESLESLPAELQRNFELMRDLDSRAQEVMKDIDKLGDEYLSSSSSPLEKRKELQTKINRLFNKAKEYGDDKVQLSIQTYELVDKHIRRLDSDLARFETDIKNGPSVSDPPISPSTTNTTTTGKTSKRGRKKDKESTSSRKSVKLTDDEKTTSSGGKGKGGRKGAKTGSQSPSRKKGKNELVLAAESVVASNSSEGGLDMPVDPNEPTYCICHQVSYGQMIACDNSECTIEWFHIQCLNLTTVPKGKWYCPKCAPAQRKK